MTFIDISKRPEGPKYKYKVRNQTFESSSRFITGREVLESAGLIPPSNFKLDLKLKGNVYREIRLEEKVDLAEPGIEKFTYISRDQTEG